MARTILEVDAKIVDANGVFNHLNGYPKKFDSKSYQDDLEGTMKRAKSEYFSTLSAMYGNQAGRQIQAVSITNAYGHVILCESIGGFSEDTPVEPE